MFSKIRARTTYANVVATVAMVFAMTGGAYAASKVLITSTKQIKPSVLAQLKGKAGRAGAQGLVGPTGPQGPAGANGKDGALGANGTNGAPGESVTSAALSKGDATCKEGGAKFTVGGKETFACSGKQGEKGSPWVAGGTLPSGQSEMGTWFTVFGKAVFGGVYGLAPISASFAIPLSAALTTTGCEAQPQPETCQVHIINGAGEELIVNELGEFAKVKQRSPAPCSGSAAAPSAEPGNLCVYIGIEKATISLVTINLSSPAGVALDLLSQEEGREAGGTWAVTSA